MSNTGNSIKNDPIREIAGSAITGVYQKLGGIFLRDAFRLWITNNANGDIYLSTDGVTDMMKFAEISARAADDKTNDFYRKAGTQFWIRFDVVPIAGEGWFAMEAEYV